MFCYVKIKTTMAANEPSEEKPTEPAAPAADAGAAATNVAPPAAGSDVINLEDLVRGIDDAAPVTSMAAPVVAPQPPAAETAPAPAPTEAAGKPEEKADTATAAPATESAAATDSTEAKSDAAAAAPGVELEVFDPEKIDSILGEEDPELAAEMAELRASGFQEAASVEVDDDAVVVEALKPGLRHSIGENFRFRLLKLAATIRWMKTFGRRMLKDGKGLARELLVETKILLKTMLVNRKEQLGRGLKRFAGLSGLQKGALLLALIGVAAIGWVLQLTLQGKLVPPNQKPWVSSLADVADGVFEYDPSGEFEDFNDPLHHPEFVVLIERVVVNLRRTESAADGSVPMAAMELYVQTDNQEAAIEVKDRSVEVRDTIARSVERMSYPELVTDEGKAKVKLVIRKDLNEILTKGRVRRIYLKTFVLNPE